MAGLLSSPKGVRMAAYKDYKSSQSSPWTRIDMLLALYSGAIEQVQAALQALQQANSVECLLRRTRAAALVVAIRSGIDSTQGEMNQRVDQLCEFMQQAISIGDEKHLNSTLRVLQELHSGFLTIREQAIQMESDGRIPPLNTAPQLDATC